MARKLSLLTLSLLSIGAFTWIPYGKWRQFQREAEGHRLAILKDRSSVEEYGAIISAAASATNLTEDQRWLVSKEMKVASRTHERFETMEQIDLNKAESESAWWFDVLRILPVSTFLIWVVIWMTRRRPTLVAGSCS